MSRILRPALASFGGFLAGYAIPTLAFLLLYFFSAQPRKEGSSTFDDLMTFFYFAGVYALASAAAYALITAASRSWRERPARQIAGISAIWGAVAQILNWTGLGLLPLVPLMHVLPRNVTTVIGVAMPGAVCAVLMLIGSALRRPRKPASGS
jgi:hypothetical protein